MKNNFKQTTLLILLLIAVLFTGCRNTVDSYEKSKKVLVSGTISTGGILPGETEADNLTADEISTINNEASRTAIPDFTDKTFIYKVTATQGKITYTTHASKSSTGYTYSIPLGLGTWELSAYIYMTDSIKNCTDDTLVFEPKETLSVTVTEDETVKTVDTLYTKVRSSTYTGTISLPVNVDKVTGGSAFLASSVVAALNDTNTQTINYASDGDGTGTVTFDSAAITTGAYTLNLKFYSGADGNGKKVFECNQSINILKDCVTSVWVSDAPYISDKKFTLTNACVVYQNMTDFYVNPAATEEGTGTPYSPFKTLDTAYNTIKSYKPAKARILIKAGKTLSAGDTYEFDSANFGQLSSLTIGAYDIEGSNVKAVINKISDGDVVLFNFSAACDFTLENLVITAGNYLNISSTSTDKLMYLGGKSVTVDNCEFSFNSSSSTYATCLYVATTATISNTTITSYSGGYGAVAPVYVTSSGKLTFDNSKIKAGTTDGDTSYLSSPAISVYNASTNSLVIKGDDTEISGFAYGIYFDKSTDTTASDYYYEIQGGSIKNNKYGIYITTTTRANPRIKISGGVISENEYGFECGYSSNLPDLYISGGTFQNNTKAGIDYSCLSGTVGTVAIKLSGSAVISDGILLGTGTTIQLSGNLTTDSITVTPKTYASGTQIVTGTDYLSANYTKFKTPSAYWTIDSEGKLQQEDATFYIDFEKGSDDNNGKSKDTAFATFTKAISLLTDSTIDFTFKLCSDFTLTSSVTIGKTCSANSLTIESDTEGTKRIINANGTNQIIITSPAIKTINFNYLTFTGYKSSGSAGYLFNVQGKGTTSTFVNLSNCLIGSDDTIETAIDNSNCKNYTASIFYLNDISFTAENLVVKNNYAARFIYAYTGSKSNVELKNTEITHNTFYFASGNSTSLFYDAKDTFTNVSITDNTIYNTLQIIAVSSSNLYLGGKIVINDNISSSGSPYIYLPNSTDVINITSKLETGSSIVVNKLNYSSNPNITSGYGTYNKDDDPSEFFEANTVAYQISWNSDNSEACWENGPVKFYIDPLNGLDTYDGLTKATAYKTISRALENCVGQGFEYTFYLCNDLTAASSDDLMSTDAFINLSSNTYCYLTLTSDDSSVQRTINVGGLGTVLYSTYSTTYTKGIRGLTLSSLIFTGGKEGIHVSCEKCTIDNCIIGSDTDTLATADACSNKGTASNYALYAGCSNLTIKNTKIKNNYVGQALYYLPWNASNVQLDIEDSEISYNYLLDSSIQGSALYVKKNSYQPNVTLNNVTIKENVSETENMHAVCVLNAETNSIKGTTVIKDNKANGKQCNYYFGDTSIITPELSTGASIGISFDSSVVTLPFEFTTGYSTAQGTTEPSTYFFADDSDSYGIVWNDSSSEAVIKSTSAPVYYVCGFGSSILKVNGSLTAAYTSGATLTSDETPTGSQTLPYLSVQDAITAIGDGTGTIYVDGTVYETPGDTSDSAYSCVQIYKLKEADTDYPNITIQGITGGTGTITVDPTFTDSTTGTINSRIIGLWNGTLTLGSGITITGGNVTGSPCGGGIFNCGTLILDGCTITGNTNSYSNDSSYTYGMGGGIYANETATTTIKAGTTISNNSAVLGGGGITVNSGTLTIEGGTFSGNTATKTSEIQGTDIQVKALMYNASGNPVESSEVKHCTFTLAGEPTMDGTIYLDCSATTTVTSPIPEVLQIGSGVTLSNEYHIQVGSSASAGQTVASGGTSSDYAKLKIYDNATTASGTMSVDTDGTLKEVSYTGTITPDDGSKTKTTVQLVESISKDYFQQSDAGKTGFSLTLTSAAGAAICAGSNTQVVCTIYNAETNTIVGSSFTGQINQSDSTYTVQLYLNSFSTMDIGEYILVVSADSADDSVIIESWQTSIWMVY